MLNTVFQLTSYDIERSSTIELEDLGKWCYVSNGCISGFYDTKEGLMERLREVLNIYEE
jgi:hypothetical protein